MTKVALNANIEGAGARKRTRVSGFAAVIAAVALATMTLAGGGAAKAGELDSTHESVIDSAQIAERAQADRDDKANSRAEKDSFILELPGETGGPVYYFPPRVFWSEPDDDIPQIRLHTVWRW